MNEPTVDELVNIPSNGLTEELADKYNGSKVKIARILPPESAKSSYADKDMVVNGQTFKRGAKLPQGVFCEGKVVALETEPYGTDQQGNPLTAKIRVPLKFWNGKWGFSTHEKSTSYKLFKMLKITQIKEAVGKDVVLVKTTKQNGEPAIVVSLPN